MHHGKSAVSERGSSSRSVRPLATFAKAKAVVGEAAVPLSPKLGRSGRQSVLLEAVIDSARPFPFLHQQSPFSGKSNREQSLGKPFRRMPLGAISRAAFPLPVPNWE
jgi:hypothetical protein